MRAEQKVVAITGASQAVGAGLVACFREFGYGIVANSRVVGTMGLAGDPDILVVDGDAAAPDIAERIVSGAMERFGRLDTLVNAAGACICKPFTDYSDADFVEMTAANLAGFFHVSRRAACRMLQAGSGHIVNITAALADQPMAAMPAALTCLTKGGLDAVTRALALEYASQGVRVNAVSPGAARTAETPGLPMQGRLAGQQPMGRVGEIAEIVEAVLYLENAPFVTGEILYVEGGAHATNW
ncbi:MAG: SDR family oxidoreductase [Dongiaceae bacterium]